MLIIPIGQLEVNRILKNVAGKVYFMHTQTLNSGISRN
ncbi:MAG: hypothetical protein OFPII_23090 [Osedax symbiont Rs1]|nr:MAG: hypothetical protein OFPII_23090 [Osedax symbiont Rs1]